jgi:hypothetical protein
MRSEIEVFKDRIEVRPRSEIEKLMQGVIIKLMERQLEQVSFLLRKQTCYYRRFEGSEYDLSRINAYKVKVPNKENVWLLFHNEEIGQSKSMGRETAMKMIRKAYEEELFGAQEPRPRSLLATGELSVFKNTGNVRRSFDNLVEKFNLHLLKDYEIASALRWFKDLGFSLTAEGKAFAKKVKPPEKTKDYSVPSKLERIGAKKDLQDMSQMHDGVEFTKLKVSDSRRFNKEVGMSGANE